MANRLRPDRAHPAPALEDAMILDDLTATYAAAFAVACARLGRRATPGAEHVALRLAQQMHTAAAAYWTGRRLGEDVWLPEGAREQ